MSSALWLRISSAALAGTRRPPDGLSGMAGAPLFAVRIAARLGLFGVLSRAVREKWD